MTEDACPRAAEHTPDPVSYVGWFEWAEAMSRTHKQRRCEGCGLLAIWEPLEPGAVLLDPADYETGCVVIKARGMFV